MKNKKVMALLSGLGLCFAASATELDSKVNVEQELNAIQKVVEQKQVPIYDVSFNHNWEVISEFLVDDLFIYLPKSDIPKDLLDTVGDRHIVSKAGRSYLKVPRSLVKDINTSQLKIYIELNKDYIDRDLDLRNLDKTPVSKSVDAFIGDYQLGYNDVSGKTYFTLDGTYFSKNNLELTGGIGNNGEENTRSAFYLKKSFEDNSVLRVGEGTSNQHTAFNNANVLGFKYSTAYFNEQNSDVSMYSPILPIQGYSVNPSSMDLFINDRLYQTYDLGVGNYDLKLPLTTALGTGVFKTVIRDKFGNPQVIEIPFFTHKELVKKGHLEYEFGVGALQDNNSGYSRSYSGKKYAADTIFKYGLTDDLSASLFLQNTRDRSLGELKVDFTTKNLPGLVTLGYAHNSKKQGWGTVGFQSKKFNSSVNYAVNYSFATKNDFCYNFIDSCTNKRLSAYMSYTSPHGFGNFNLGYANSKANNKDIQTLSLSWNKKISKNVHLHTGLYKNKGINNGIVNNSLQANVSLTINFSDKMSTSHSYSKSEGSSGAFSNTLYVQEDNRNPIRGFGSIQTTNKDGKNTSNIQYQNNALSFAKYTAFIESESNKINSNHNLSGSFFYLPEKNYYGFTKSSEGGVTLVEVENGTKGISVLQSNRYSTKTNNKGIAVVTGTKPNTFNSVSLDIETIPFDRPVDKLQYDYISPKAGASMIQFKMAVEPFEITIKGVGVGGLIHINNEYYMVSKEGKSIVGFEGSAKYERNDGSVCDLEIARDKKEYICW